MKKLIIAVHAVRNNYTKKEFNRHIRYIAQLCSRKSVAYMFVDENFANDDLADDDDENEDYYLPEKPSEVENYWAELVDSLGEYGIYLEFTGNYSNPRNLAQRKYNPYEHIEEKYIEVADYFHDLFSYPKRIVQFLFDNDHDALITDFNIGQYIIDRYPSEFCLVHVCPYNLEKDKYIALAKRRIEEYDFILRWKNRESPKVMCDNAEGGFYLYTFSNASAQDPKKMITTEGIIVEKGELYWFRGHINKYRILLKKYRFEPDLGMDEAMDSGTEQVIWLGEGKREFTIEDGEISSSN